MKKAETRLQEKCEAILSDRGIAFVSNIIPSESGQGDTIACIKGRYVEFEYKIDKNGLRGSQKVRQKEVMHSGGVHYAIKDINSFVSFVDMLPSPDELKQEIVKPSIAPF